ncbi:glycosyl transferase family 2 [Lactobacillus sp. CBA3605]|uniref:glycosyltransferase family 2 protein n=1 Tax=Lactobacillus sp. CBA3605 TaxID=2099788 RepID=UPI000CFB088C|nr:glycosyltransferase family 2 protein [Lactobacillus sp. CBA3605]AVK62253.1 glycosyl transferase family 2 [Lactobacillus sp. CBA3605]
MKYVSVIVTFNRQALLKQAIESLCNQSLPPQQIIVVDNASTDGTAAMMADYQDAQVHYIRLPQNVGGAGGFYQGIKVAKRYRTTADWVSLSDDDAVFEPDYFEKIAQAAKQHPTIKAFAGTVEFMDGTKQLDQRQRLENWTHFDAQAVPELDYQHDFFIDLFTFCGCVINFDLMIKTGMPRQDFFIWWDDIEYSIRLRKNTEILNVSPAVLVHHTVKPRPDEGYQQNWKEYYWFRNRTVTVRELGRHRLGANLWALGQIVERGIEIVRDGRRYRGQRGAALRVTASGVLDGFRHKMGANHDYMPK